MYFSQKYSLPFLAVFYAGSPTGRGKNLTGKTTPPVLEFMGIPGRVVLEREAVLQFRGSAF
jgi:hypothetical protein